MKVHSRQPTTAAGALTHLRCTGVCGGPAPKTIRPKPQPVCVCDAVQASTDAGPEDWLCVRCVSAGTRALSDPGVQVLGSEVKPGQGPCGVVTSQAGIVGPVVPKHGVKGVHTASPRTAPPKFRWDDVATARLAPRLASGDQRPLRSSSPPARLPQEGPWQPASSFVPTVRRRRALVPGRCLNAGTSHSPTLVHDNAVLDAPSHRSPPPHTPAVPGSP